MGDYTQMAASGDHVYSAFPDSRLGDPDVFVDASVFRPTSTCPEDLALVEGQATAQNFTLGNHGNFETRLSWRLVDDAGWIASATPAPSGTQSLEPNGGQLVVQALIDPPADCHGDSTIVRFITSDPFVPGREDTCITVVRCGDVTSAPTAPPERPSLAVRAPSSTPAPRGGLVVSVSLPSDSPARLELIDVAGRRIASHEVGGLGPGTHELKLMEPAITSGVYLLRLSQSDRAATAKAVVVR
jgi:hypothetical protein